MLSAKEDAQRRMLSPKNTPKTGRFTNLANIANRSPLGKNENRDQMSSNTLESRKLLSDLPRTQQNAPQTNYASSRVGVAQKAVSRRRIVFPNTDTYEGQTVNGAIQGKGVYQFTKEYFIYDGQFENSRQHGYGTLINKRTKQILYEGEWKFGMKNGEGRYSYGPDNYYQGEWKNDQKNGKGLYHFEEGIYNGGWVNNRREGNGNLKLKNGVQFKGTFVNNQFVKGLIRYSNSDEYSGPVRNNLKQGQEGSYFEAKTNIRYKGQWANDKKQGKGTIFYENGDELSGTFVNGTLSEQRVLMYRFRDGAVFNGWFRQGQANKGTITKPNGQKWEI